MKIQIKKTIVRGLHIHCSHGCLLGSWGWEDYLFTCENDVMASQTDIERPLQSLIKYFLKTEKNKS